MSKCKKCNKQLATKNYEKINGTKEERDTLQTRLYNFIIDLRDQGYPLKEIASKTGLDKSSISYYINNKRKVGMNAVRKYAKQQADGEDG